MDNEDENLPQCPICFEASEQLLRLACDHHYHLECAQQQLHARWPGPNITFSYMNCALCRQKMEHPALGETIHQHIKLEQSIRNECLNEIAKDEYKEVMLGNEDLMGEALAEFALHTLAYFRCGTCGDFFCGGLQSCAELMDTDSTGFQCPACQFPDHVQPNDYQDLTCKIHTDYHNEALFKCDSCCKPATWRCVNDRYCAPHHDRAYDPDKAEPCTGPIDCPLRIRHPPNFGSVHGSPRPHNAFIIGCARCLEEKALADLLDA